jgi:hypothetical protein
MPLSGFTSIQQRLVCVEAGQAFSIQRVKVLTPQISKHSLPLHTRKVAGSIPAGTTNNAALKGHFRGFRRRPCQIRAERLAPLALWSQRHRDRLGWVKTAETVVVSGKPSKGDLESCWELGATVAAQLMG